MSKQLIKYTREEIMQAYNDYKEVCHSNSYDCHAILSAYNKYMIMAKGSGMEIDTNTYSSVESDFDEDLKPVRCDYE